MATPDRLDQEHFLSAKTAAEKLEMNERASRSLLALDPEGGRSYLQVSFFRKVRDKRYPGPEQYTGRDAK